MARVWIGTSGFSYKEWKGAFYPADLSPKGMLPFYAGRFRSVEIDSTFYRMPTANTVSGWKDATPEDFRFVVKASQQITHRERLRTPSESLNYLTSTVAGLATKLGLLTFQLPPFMRRDVSRLDSFLQALPAGLPAAMEFRHESWFVPEVLELLRRYGAVLCLHDSEAGCTPMELTAPAVYVRLRRPEYSQVQREEWRLRFRNWAEEGIEVFAYVKHKDNPDAPRIALEFAAGL